MRRLREYYHQLKKDDNKAKPNSSSSSVPDWIKLALCTDKKRVKE
jgi:hypothetical protein